MADFGVWLSFLIGDAFNTPSCLIGDLPLTNVRERTLLDGDPAAEGCFMRREGDGTLESNA